jgi:hypothetical protein
MSRELAVPGAGDITGVQGQRLITQMRAAREYAKTFTEDEALKAKKDARVAWEWAKIHDAAREVAVEACKLQATAVRRLAQLGSRHIAGQGRAAAEWLGSMSDEAFAALLDSMKSARSPATLYRDHRSDVEREAKFRRGQEIADGEGFPADYDSVCRAATYILNVAMAGGATTVNELAEALGSELGYGDTDMGDPVIREGIEVAIREALRSENISGEAHPDFVTWKDREAGWLRIPWPAATIDQLRWMAEFREEQARELAEAAETLRILVRDLDAIRADNRHLTRLNDLWAALQAALAAEEEAA